MYSTRFTTNFLLINEKVAGGKPMKPVDEELLVFREAQKPNVKRNEQYTIFDYLVQRETTNDKDSNAIHNKIQMNIQNHHDKTAKLSDTVSSIAEVTLQLDKIVQAARQEESNLLEKRGTGIKTLITMFDDIDDIKIALSFVDHKENEYLINIINEIYDVIEKRMIKLGFMIENPEGKMVDTDLHEIDAVEKNPLLKNETIIRVLKKGCMYKGTLIRKAKVITILN